MQFKSLHTGEAYTEYFFLMVAVPLLVFAKRLVNGPLQKYCRDEGLARWLLGPGTWYGLV